MPNCMECSAHNLCTTCDGNLVVNAVGDGCTGNMKTYKLEVVC